MNRGSRSCLMTAWVLVFSVGSVFATNPAGAQPPEFTPGLLFMEPTAYQSIPLAAPSFAGVLPEKVSLETLPAIWNQGRQGSCVAFATAYALKTFQENRERGWGVDAPAHAFSPAYIYNQIKPPGNCEVGTYFSDALNLLAKDGAALLSDFPYDEADCDRKPSQVVRQGAAAFRIGTWRRVNTQDEMEVKTHLADGFPVLIGMPVDRAFVELRGPAVYQGLSGDALGGHAMLLSGYDDARGAFRIMNSWGQEWGDHGFGWISYLGFRKTVREGYVVQDIVALETANAPIMINLETKVFGYTPLGNRKLAKTTGDHHCTSKCGGEPTRTNYRLEIDAQVDTVLRNPQIRCLAGPCEGWNAVLSVTTEDGGRRALASWDVWSHPTTWELTAEELRIEMVSRFERRIKLGDPFSIQGETGAPPPTVSGSLSSGETFQFVAGRPTFSQFIRFVGLEIQGSETVFKYESGRP